VKNAVIEFRKGYEAIRNPLILMARPEGFEPPADGFEGHCSIQLSYERRYDRGIDWCRIGETCPGATVSQLPERNQAPFPAANM
jgi:hypothetical protein